jgi:hypothetical protein
MSNNGLAWMTGPRAPWHQCLWAVVQVLRLARCHRHGRRPTQDIVCRKLWTLSKHARRKTLRKVRPASIYVTSEEIYSHCTPWRYDQWLSALKLSEMHPSWSRTCIRSRHQTDFRLWFSFWGKSLAGKRGILWCVPRICFHDSLTNIVPYSSRI